MWRRFPAAGWVAVGWTAVALLAMRGDGLAVRSNWAYLVYDPADLAAFALRGANAHAGRLPGRTDEPRRADDLNQFAERLNGPQPALSDRFYLEYPAPALGLFWLEAAAVGPAPLPPAAADAEHTDVAFHVPRTDAERAAWGRLRAAARLHVVLMAVALLGLLAVLRAGYTPGPAAGRWLWLAGLPAAVYFALMRYDVLPALATALAFRCVGRGQWGWAGMWLAVGVGLKVYPVLFLPVVLRYAVGGRDLTPRPPLRSGEGEKVRAARTWWESATRLLPLSASERGPGGEVNAVGPAVRLLTGFALTLLALVAVSLATVGVESTVAPIRLQLGRPPELGMWVLYGRLLPAGLAYSSTGRLGLLAAVVLACVVTRPADLPAALRRCGLILLAFTQLSVFWSPQWLVWFLPLVVPLAATDRWTGWAAAAVDLCVYLSFPVLFHLGWGTLLEADREPVAEGLIVVRTLAWGWLGWRLLVGGRVRIPAEGFRVGELTEVIPPPRGLWWLSISRAGAPLLRGRTALQPVTVWFEPLPDGGLEDVPQAREPRPAVAVYAWDGRRWAATGKLVFNLSAEELAARLP